MVIDSAGVSAIATVIYGGATLDLSYKSDIDEFLLDEAYTGGQ